jgi:hypothetical protein
MKRKEQGCLMGCSIKGNGKEGPLVVDGQPTGLILNHAYGLSDIMELDDPNDDKGAFRLLRLRNPWGKSEFIGAWDPNSIEMERYKHLIINYINTLPPDEQFDLDADDGTFIMSYEDWRDNFSTLFINVDFPEDWTGVRFKSAWTLNNSGGLPAKY